MDGGKCILMLRGERPFLSQKYDLLKHPRYKYLSDADKTNTFNVGRFLSARLRPRPDDVFDVYEVDVPEDTDA
jgi:type IV secretion system protein VirD4